MSLYVGDDVATVIRREETLAALASERCHHFTKGPCAACQREDRAEALGRELEELEAWMDAHPDDRQAERRWLDLSCDLGELSAGV
jgi:hypothetical protein